MIRPRSAPGIRTAATLIAVVAALYLAREILIPLAFAITLALVLSPAVSWVQKLHIRRLPAVFGIVLVLVTATGAVGYVIFNQLIQVVSDLPAYRENIDNKIKALRAPQKGSLGQAAQSVQELGKELATAQELPAPPPAKGRAGPSTSPTSPLAVQVVETPPNGLLYVRDLLRPFLAPLVTLGIVLVFTVFLLVEESDLRNRLFRLAGVNRVNVMTQALDDATRRVSRYLMLQFLVNSVFGLLFGTGLFLIGVPYAALFGTVAALLRTVPYVGSVVAGLLPVLLSLAVFNTWAPPIMVFLLLTTLELITGNFLEPWLYGAQTGISSLALLVTAVFWAVLWGPAGLILSTPLTVCVVVLGRHVLQLSFLHILLGDQPVLAAEAHLYQRLLAMDEIEARTVAEEYLKEHSLLQLYDAVILPALTMAEQDRHKGALDPEREEFLFLSVREMLAEFSEKAKNSADHNALEHDAEPLELVATGRILCLPAQDEADEIAAAMLAQLLEQAGHASIAFPMGFFPDNLPAALAPARDDVICISAVPPFAFSQARAMNRQLRAKFPKTKILIGVWGFNGEIDRARQRFQPSPPEKLVGSMADALEYLGVTAPADVVEAEPQVAPHLLV